MCLQGPSQLEEALERGGASSNGTGKAKGPVRGGTWAARAHLTRGGFGRGGHKFGTHTAGRSFASGRVQTLDLRGWSELWLSVGVQAQDLHDKKRP